MMKGFRFRFMILFSLLVSVMMLGSVVLASTELASDLSGSYKEVSAESAEAGSTLVYTIVVSNSGDAVASNVMVTDTLPSALSYVNNSVEIEMGAGSSTTQLPTFANGAVKWAGSVAANQSVTLTFSAVLSGSLAVGTVVTNSAELSTLTQTLDATTTIIQTVVPPAVSDFSLSKKMVSAASAEPGDLLTYTIAIQNSGNATATGVLLTDTLPSTLTYVPSSINAQIGAGVTIIKPLGESNGVISWQGTVAPAGMLTVTFRATVKSNVVTGTQIENTASLDDNGKIYALTAKTGIVVIPTSNANLSGSTKTVSPALANRGARVNYTIVIANSGSENANGLLFTDTLPAGITFISGTLAIQLENNTLTEKDLVHNNGVITWGGIIGTGRSVIITFGATVDKTNNVGQTILNSAEMVVANQRKTVSATFTVVNQGKAYLPILMIPLYAPTDLVVGRPNSSNERSLSWSAILGVTGYEIQEDTDPTFGSPTEYSSTTNSYLAKPAPSWENEHYYRVRAVTSSGTKSDWSVSKNVVGAYFDDFGDSKSGWKIVRWTNAGSESNRVVKSFYEQSNGSSYLVMQVLDKWDWGISSPLKKAPALPYQIEFRTQAANLGQYLSHGIAYNGNYDGGDCIIFDGTTENLYKRTNCFKHFYNTNILNKVTNTNNTFKLLWERVDELAWCLGCGGSPMKRLGNDREWPLVDPIKGVTATGWNNWRIEVRADTAKLYGNDNVLIAEFRSDKWKTDPYFGIFASTDMYNNSTWRFDWVRVTPLDN